MGRRSGRRHQVNYDALDAVFQEPLAVPRLLERWSPGPDMSVVEDRRQYHPWGSWAAPRLSDGSPSAVAIADQPPKRKPGRLFLPFGLKFGDVKKTLVCVRRKQRREVLFAKGRGGGGHKKPRRNEWSDVSCR